MRGQERLRRADGRAATAVVVAAAVAAGCSPGRAPEGGTEGAASAKEAPQAAASGAAAERDKALRTIKELSVDKLPSGVAIDIDGRLDEAAWKTAAATGPFVHVGTGRVDASLPTQGEARLLWDDTHLYVAFDVRDASIRGGFPPDAKDPHLWERDTVEVMLDPDGDGDNKDYYEIQINPQNLVFDTQYDGYNHPNGNGKGPFGHEAWSAGLVSAVQIRGTMDDDGDRDDGYTVEAKIPWASFTKAESAPPSPGDVWRMNFYAMQNNGGTAWSPILGQGNFHRARRFGRVRFVAPLGDPGSAAAPSAKGPSPAASAMLRGERPPAAVSGADSAGAGKGRAAAPASPGGRPGTPAGSPSGLWAGHPDR